MFEKAADPRQRVLVAVGLPGAGKSTYLAGLDVGVLSSDHLRLLLADDEDDQTIHAEVFEALRYLLVKRIQIGRAATCVDATNLLRAHRRPFIRIAKSFGCRLEALHFRTPLKECLRRNQTRARRVPEEVVREMSASMEPPTLDEGFDEIVAIDWDEGSAQ